MSSEALVGIVPAGGLGTRLRPHTFETPKPLLSMGSSQERLIDSALDLLEGSCTEVIVTTQYMAEMVEGHVSQSYEGVVVMRDHATVGTAGALLVNAIMREHLDSGDDIVFMPSDHIHEGICMEDYSLFHRESGADITLLTATPKSYGEFVRTENDRATGVLKAREPGVVSTTGIFMMKSRYLLDWVTRKIRDGYDGRAINMYHDFIVPAVESAIVATYQIPPHGYWDDAGTLERYWVNNMRLSGGENVISPEASVASAQLTRCVVLGEVELSGLELSDSVISNGSNGPVVSRVDYNRDMEGVA